MPADALPIPAPRVHAQCRCGPLGGNRRNCKAPEGAIHKGAVAAVNVIPPANPANPGGKDAVPPSAKGPPGKLCNRDFGHIAAATIAIIVKDGVCLRCGHPVAAHDITIPANHPDHPPAPTHIHQAPQEEAAKGVTPLTRHRSHRSVGGTSRRVCSLLA
jgi:hypothetical protein